MDHSSDHLACSNPKCLREIPVAVLWAALVSHSKLQCSQCATPVTRESLRQTAATSGYAQAVLVTFSQLVTYGWTSAHAVVQSGATVDPQVLGGLLAGLQRAGLIERTSPSSSAAHVALDTRPIFRPGPTFPAAPAARS